MDEKFVEILEELLKANRKMHELTARRLDALEDRLNHETVQKGT